MMQPQHSYAQVDHREHHDDDSSTEVESLAGAEKGWAHGEFQHTSQRTNRRILCPPLVAALRWVLIIGLQLIIIGLLARDQGLLDSTRFRGLSTSANDPGGDITGWSPHIPTQITTFKINQTFAPYNTSEFFQPEVLRAWNELLPKGMGFQSIPDPSLYHDLPTPIIWPNATVYTTSMTHQLHCLYAVVAVYSGLTSNHTLEDDHHWHMIHCFDYMRQAILCSADMALEGLETTFPDHNGGSDGWDSKHVCKDPRAVRERLESVRAYDDQEIF
ncbi:hypothetical protein HBH70_238430 [Parastagonospora nodorum]|nr:hypothetical protein HBI09_131750 [Parastagonospora nodorum]KAH4047785.1 hypothetical protein HBH49_169680 [Parastagonospora nodorum]KAH4055866.1 hypothetical protein HBH50_244190 [Parastagonospora nodorum]KAH4077371.1 hypothetical protein HBH48_242870 [Parastagonospora nodorum]KAH4080251.1 hypothetical protein HBH46_231190 [Parastagonospora nodorum]